MANYIHLFMEEGEELTLSEDLDAPLVTEVFHLCLFHDLIYYIISISFHPFYSIHNPIFMLYRKYVWQMISDKWQI